MSVPALVAFAFELLFHLQKDLHHFGNNDGPQ